MSTYNLSWFQNAFSDLQNELLTIAKLKEIKVALSALHSSQISKLASSLPLKILFDCLNTVEIRQIEMTCDVLKILLSSVPPIVMFQQYEVELARALKHPEKCVKETILHELSRLEGERDVELLIGKRPSFISDVLELLCDDDLAIAQTAMDLLTKIGETECGFISLLSGDTDGFLQLLNEASAIHSLRIYQVMLEIGAKSESKLSRLENAGLLRGFGKLLTSDDILGKMAAIEELSKLVATLHGYRFLLKQNCIHVLSKELIDAHQSPMFTLITPGLLKFFGCACSYHTLEIQRDFPEVVETILLLVHSDDITISTTAIEAIGFICTSSNGKKLINQSGDACMMKVAQKMEEVVNKGQTEWKHRVLYALANLINVESGDMKDNEVVYLTRKWFFYLGENVSGTSMMFTLSKNPFPEVKLAAFHVISKLALLPWGQEEINKYPGGLSYLLDRTTETDMAAILAKYGIITALSESPTSIDVFSEVDHGKIIEYHKQGATYAMPKLYVAVEGAE